jgi:hypothetical protein
MCSIRDLDSAPQGSLPLALVTSFSTLLCSVEPIVIIIRFQFIVPIRQIPPRCELSSKCGLSRLLGHPFLLASHLLRLTLYLNSLYVCKYIGVCIGLLFHWFIYLANHNCSLLEFPKIGSLSGWTSGGVAVEVAPCMHED